MKLAHFKKVREDNHVAVLKHPNGHEIRIAKKALSPNLARDLKSLPLHLAEGGGPPIQYAQLEADKAQEDQPYVMGGVQLPQAPQAQADQTLPPPSEAIPIAASPDTLNQNYPLPTQTPPGGAGKLGGALASAGMANKAPMDSGSAQDYQTAITGVESSIADQAKAAAQQGRREVTAARANQIAVQNIENTYVKNHQAIDTNVANTQKDIDSFEIKPNHYFENLSVPGKISTAIGLLLGGLGSGLTGGPNAAMQFFEAQMNRDVEAQKANLGKKETLLSGYLKQYGNLQDATDMARITQANIYSTKLKQAAANAMEPAAKANALKAASEFELNVALPLKNQFALRQALLGQGQGGQTEMIDGKPVQTQNDPQKLISYLRITNPAMAKEMEARHVPGVGMAEVPVPETARAEMGGRASLQEQVRNLRQWSSAHSGSIDPSEIAYGKALSNSVQDAYRRANAQGVFKEAEAHFVQGIVDQDPTRFFNKYRTDPKYKALEDSNQMALNGLKKTYGLPTSQEAAPPPVQHMNGVAYQRGSDGNYHRVK